MTASTGKKLVLLINSAPFSREYFTELGQSLAAQGATVSYALESHLSDVISGDDKLMPDGHYFTDFCREWRASGNELPTLPDLPWKSLLADFDRFLTYRMTPPLAKSGSMTYAEVLVLLEIFFEKMFDEVEPDGVVYEPVSNSFAMAAYRAARRRGIPFFSLSLSRIPGHVEISSTGFFRDHETIAAILSGFEKRGIPARSREIAENYIASIDHNMPDYMKKGGDGAAQMEISLTAKYLNRGKVDRIVRSLRYRRKHRQDLDLAYQAGDPLIVSWVLFRRSLERRLRLRSVIRLFQKEVEAPAYLLYPLHFHPESSTSILAADYIDELSVIKAIAFRLPVNVKLVVKEHPSALALQPLSFYRELAAMPNVELVAPGLNGKALARKSIGVICLTSTLGFEAAVLNKPVICMGDVFYGYFPNVRMIENYGELDDALRWAMDYQPIDPERIVEATAAYVDYIKPGSFSFKNSLGDTAAIDNIAGIILGKLPAVAQEGATSLAASLSDS